MPLDVGPQWEVGAMKGEMSLSEVARMARRIARWRTDKIIVGVPAHVICPPSGWMGIQWEAYGDDRWEVVLIVGQQAEVRWYDLAGNQIGSTVQRVERI